VVADEDEAAGVAARQVAERLERGGLGGLAALVHDDVGEGEAAQLGAVGAGERADEDGGLVVEQRPLAHEADKRLGAAVAQAHGLQALAHAQPLGEDVLADDGLHAGVGGAEAHEVGAEVGPLVVELAHELVAGAVSVGEEQDGARGLGPELALHDRADEVGNERGLAGAGRALDEEEVAGDEGEGGVEGAALLGVEIGASRRGRLVPRAAGRDARNIPRHEPLPYIIAAGLGGRCWDGGGGLAEEAAGKRG
jgi:hypothetical protein